MKVAILIGFCAVGALFIAHQIRLMIRDARANKRARTAEPPPAAVPASERLVGILDWGGVIVEVSGGAILVLLPQLDAKACDRIPSASDLGRQIRRVIVINDPTLGGYLWTTKICEAFGIEPGKVHATVAKGRIDRSPDGEVPYRTANPLPADLREGSLALRALGRNGVLVLDDDYPDGGILIGAAITEDQLIGQRIRRVIGSTSGTFTQRAALEPMLIAGGGERCGFVLLADTAPGLDDKVVAWFREIGFPVQIVQPPPAWAAPAKAMVDAIRANDTGALAALLDAEDHMVVARAMVGLIAGGDRATARTLGDAALAKGDHPEVRHQLAVLATLAGDRDAAERHLRAAIVEPVHAPSLINLSVTLARRGDPEAIALADRAVELMPEDPLAHRAAILARAHAGKLDDARARTKAATVLDMPTRVVLERLIDAIANGEPPAEVVDTFPMHADLALARGRELLDAGSAADAVVALQRAFELHPLGLEIAGELGFALAQAGRDADAIAHYDAAIERVPGGDLLRLNRGNARRRGKDFAGAIADYQELLRKLPELREARIGMIVALADAGRGDDATVELAVLAEQGAPPELIAQLEAVIAGGDART